MTSLGAGALHDDPFGDEDSARSTDVLNEPGGDGTLVLALGKGVRLELTGEGLHVLDSSLKRPKQYDCCGIMRSTTPPKKSPTHIIPYHYILWAEVDEDAAHTPTLIVRYCTHEDKKTVRPTNLTYQLDKTTIAQAITFTTTLLDRAYTTKNGPSQRRKRVKILINPFGGQGKAQAIYFRQIAGILKDAGCTVDVLATKYQGHAKEIARDLNADEWDILACCSGDGLPHEVFNGLALQSHPRAALHKLAVVQLPCGSGNAMSLNLNGTNSPSLAALALVKGMRIPMDLVSITQGEERYISFLSQSIGIVAESDLGTEHLRWMGSMRFDIGFAMRAFGKKQWPVDIAYLAEEGMTDKKHIKDRWQKHADLGIEIEDGKEEDLIAQPDLQATSMPSLKYGTINDPTPSSWTELPYPNLGNFYAGNMAYMAPDANFFPAALPCDGNIDMITMRGDVSGFKAIALGEQLKKHTFFDDPLVEYRKVVAYRCTPRQDSGFISIDGESVPFKPWQVEVHRGLATVLSKTGGRVFEARGP